MKWLVVNGFVGELKKGDMALQSVLIVDDSKSARVMLSRLLAQYDLQVDQAESADKAFIYLNTNKPDLIFMDHLMPGTDGLTATKQILDNPDFAKLPIVIYTSNEDPYYRQKATDAGAVAILHKPANKSLLQEILSEISGDTVRPESNSEVMDGGETALEPDLSSVEAIGDEIDERDKRDGDGIVIPQASKPRAGSEALQGENFWAEVDHRIREEGKQVLRSSVATEVSKLSPDLMAKMQLQVSEEINAQLSSEPRANSTLKSLVVSVATDAATKMAERTVFSALERWQSGKEQGFNQDLIKPAVSKIARDVAEKMVSEKIEELGAKSDLFLNSLGNKNEPSEEGGENAAGDGAPLTGEEGRGEIEQVEALLSARIQIVTDELNDLQKSVNLIRTTLGSSMENSKRIQAIEDGPLEKLREALKVTRIICYLGALTAGFAIASVYFS